MVKSRWTRRFVVSLLLGVSIALPADAQFQTPNRGGKLKTESGFYTDALVTIPVRGAGHENYSRLVFEWPEKVAYELKEVQKGVLDFIFQRRALVDMGDVRAAPETNFGKVEVLSGLREHLHVRVTIPETAQYRAYPLGYKIVLDVDDVPGQKRGEGLPVNAEPAHAIPNAAEGAAPPAAPATEQQPLPTTSFGWTATRVFPLAAFIRNDALYLVTDKDASDVTFAPQLKIGSIPADRIEKLPSDKGQVYRVRYGAPGSPIPDIAVTGGGLAWTITLNPAQKPDAKPATLDIVKQEGQPALVANLPDANSTLTFTDPRSGETFTAVMTGKASPFSRNWRNGDAELIGGGTGFGIVPHNDRLSVKIDSGKVTIAAPNGLDVADDALPPPNEEDEQAIVAAPKMSPEAPSLSRRMFYFDRWLVGLPVKYFEARQELETKLSEAPEENKPEILLSLARFNLAYGFAPEALGYTDLAALMVPQLEQDAEFRALRGASLSLIGDGEAALRDLNDTALDSIPEIGVWRAFAATKYYDWQGAFQYMPTDLTVLSYYPQRIRSEITIALAETLLRASKPQDAEALLNSMVAGKTETLSNHEQAALDYLRGEAKRAQGQPIKAIEYWNKAETSNDQLYRVKATLAKTVLQMQERAVKPQEAIERLERLRFAWRGDGLETQIAQILGRLYLTNQKWDDAFTMMRDAAGFASGSAEGNAITAAMTQAFAQLFTNPPADIKPMEAIAIYDRFPELVPAGEEGKAVQRGLAQYLLQVDLLNRAGDIYEALIPYDKNGIETLNDGLQLVAVRLLAREPKEALAALDMPQIVAAKGTPEQMRQKSLLRARALSDLKRTDDALALLAGLSVANDTLSLITDTAWRAQRWDLAAQSLSMLLERTNLAADTLDERQTNLIVSQAVSLRLAGKEKELATLRARFLRRLADPVRQKQFDAISRPDQEVTLSDRETLLSMANEVDLFESFLNTAATATPAAPVSAPAAAPAAAQTTAAPSTSEPGGQIPPPAGAKTPAAEPQAQIDKSADQKLAESSTP